MLGGSRSTQKPGQFDLIAYRDFATPVIVVDVNTTTSTRARIMAASRECANVLTV
jgi:hypothetical protein